MRMGRCPHTHTADGRDGERAFQANANIIVSHLSEMVEHFFLVCLFPFIFVGCFFFICNLFSNIRFNFRTEANGSVLHTLTEGGEGAGFYEQSLSKALPGEYDAALFDLHFFFKFPKIMRKSFVSCWLVKSVYSLRGQMVKVEQLR